jgi:HD-GYP domain-containing protein (c-di-GMP phosphodiesterase class II)
MPGPLNHALHQTCFVVRKSPLTEHLRLPKELTTREVSGEIELVEFAKQGFAGATRIVLVLADHDFIPTINLLREKALVESSCHLGVVVVSKVPANLLTERHAFPELVDVVLDKALEEHPQLHLLRAVRHMVRVEEIKQPRLGHQTLLKLNEIFIALSAERDPQELLATILRKAIELTTAEGGTLFMIEEKDGEITFRVRIGQRPGAAKATFEYVSERVTESCIAGYVALTGKSVNIADVSNLRPYTLPTYNKELDYHDSSVRSVLTVPLKNRRSEIIAVLQLANKRSAEEGPEIAPAPFEVEDDGLLSSYCTQAAICLENVDLYGDIQQLFDGFVKAAITAIESRDPSTGGHSERVAKMCVALARATTECQSGVYRSVRFKEEEIRELEYAALLHDFGKIGVREEVLVKAKKLYPYQLEGINERIKICKAAARIQYLELKVKGGSNTAALDAEYERRLKELDAFWSIIVSANEPSILKKDVRDTLERIRTEKLMLPDGSHVAVLTEEEFTALSVPQGSLTEGERMEVESHVRHTYQFLKMIPWTRDFKHLTEIAYAHHEKLDGTGYPRGLSSHEIPLQSKIMTISDIFDALTAADRWYKDAVPTEKALEILGDEVGEGKLDPVLYEIFVEKKIYLLNNFPATASKPKVA